MYKIWRFVYMTPLVPLTGGVSGGVLPAELQNFLYPLPHFEKLLTGCAEHCVCMYGVPYRNLGVWGSPSSPTGFREGV